MKAAFKQLPKAWQAAKAAKEAGEGGGWIRGPGGVDFKSRLSALG